MTQPSTMPMSQRLILDRRWKEATARQPELKKLLRLLLKFGGGFVVAPPYPDPDLDAIITSGFVQAGAVVVKKGRVSQCHENIAGIWRLQKYGIVGIGTGYALSDDGLWRQHSWGVLRGRRAGNDGGTEQILWARFAGGLCAAVCRERGTNRCECLRTLAIRAGAKNIFAGQRISVKINCRRMS
jgi:hypothetical protein